MGIFFYILLFVWACVSLVVACTCAVNNSSFESQFIVGAGGSVGVGTENPTAKLHVIGDARVGFDTSQGVILTSPNSTQYRLIVDDSGNLSTIAV